MDVRVRGSLAGVVAPPPSKSQAHRLLICAALGSRDCRVACSALNDDLVATMNCMNSLGDNIEYKDGCLLVPEEGYPYNFYTEICYPSGYIKRYIFNGTRFINKDRIYDTEIPLPEKLRNFKANIVILDFKPFISFTSHKIKK